MKRSTFRLPVSNFGRDTRPQVRMIATAMFALGTLIAASAGWLMIDRQQLLDEATAMNQLGVRLTVKRDALRRQSAKLPAPGEFERLRGRIEALNRLDFDASVSVGDLLDAFEAALPDYVMITSLDYDRAVRTIDLAAISASSEDLTTFFDTLYRTGLFSQVRLVDKMQIEAQGTAQTQVRISLQVGARRLPGPAEAKS